tara:strand:+ start:277 stop:465 length:189 start_codon:yes stop_codon:yes gene_type:complete
LASDFEEQIGQLKRKTNSDKDIQAIFGGILGLSEEKNLQLVKVNSSDKLNFGKIKVLSEVKK